MTDMTVANTILKQLGGNRFIAMTGAKNLLGDESSLQFSIGRGATCGINKVKIELAADVYRMTFYKIRGTDVKAIRSLDMVYAEQLAQNFTDITGFDTRI